METKFLGVPSLFYSFAASWSPSQVVIFSLGLFLSCPAIFSLESIFSQPLNGTKWTFFCSRISTSPVLPCFFESDGALNTPFVSSSRMLATWLLTHKQNKIKKKLTKWQPANKCNEKSKCETFHLHDHKVPVLCHEHGKVTILPPTITNKHYM